MRMPTILRQPAALLMIGSVFVVAGCATRAPSPQTPLGELPAHYAGTLPCADCPGIDDSLSLTADHHYILQAHYQGTAPSHDFVEAGRWRVDPATSTLTLTPSDSDDGANNQWRIDNPDRLTALDADGRTIEANLNFSLERVDTPADAPLTATRWVMSNADEQNAPRDAYIKLAPETSRMTGSTGCNRVMGEYNHQGAQLSFQRLASTRMACGAATDTEQAYLDALSRTQRMRVVGPYLLLFGQSTDPSPLAVFRQAESR